VSFPVKILRSIVPDIVSPGRGRGEALTPGIKYSQYTVAYGYQESPRFIAKNPGDGSVKKPAKFCFPWQREGGGINPRHQILTI
jgi:hypothetical protein